MPTAAPETPTTAVHSATRTTYMAFGRGTRGTLNSRRSACQPSSPASNTAISAPTVAPMISRDGVCEMTSSTTTQYAPTGEGFRYNLVLVGKPSRSAGDAPHGEEPITGTPGRQAQFLLLSTRLRLSYSL